MHFRLIQEGLCVVFFCFTSALLLWHMLRPLRYVAPVGFSQCAEQPSTEHTERNIDDAFHATICCDFLRRLRSSTSALRARELCGMLMIVEVINY